MAGKYRLNGAIPGADQPQTQADEGGDRDQADGDRQLFRRPAGAAKRQPRPRTRRRRDVSGDRPVAIGAVRRPVLFTPSRRHIAPDGYREIGPLRLRSIKPIVSGNSEQA